MKKMRALLLVMMMSMCMFSLAACGQTGKEIVEDAEELTEEEKEDKAAGESEKEINEDIDKGAQEDAEQIVGDDD